MKKRILTLLMALSMTVLFAGCNQSTQTADTTETNETTTENTTKDNKQTGKINVNNLTEASVPIGISEASARAKGASSYVTCKITNNNDEYEETSVTLSLEVLDSTGKTVSNGTIRPDRALIQGESYVYDGYLGYGGDMVEGEVYTVKVISIEIEDGLLAEKRREFDFAVIYEFGGYLDDEEYNMAQITWEEIKETYGDMLHKEIKKYEAVMKDMGIDPEHISRYRK